MRIAGFAAFCSILTLATPARAQTQWPLPASLATLEARAFSDLQGFKDDNFLEAWNSFERTCKSAGSNRALLSIHAGIRAVCAEARKKPPGSADEAQTFFKTHFQPFEIIPAGAAPKLNPAFLTGYYEPILPGSLTQSPDFREPLLARPGDLVDLGQGHSHPVLPTGETAGRFGKDGGLESYPDRNAIDAGGLSDHARPVVWVRDAIEAFMVHVQGSAAVRLSSGSLLRLSYAGRNGHPYSSIGKILVDSGEVPLEQMSLARLKQWVRDNGQGPGDKGRGLLHQNRSFIFFNADSSDERATGPIGAAGVPLSPLRSIAIDKNLWPWGLPFWIEARIPWREPGAEAPAFGKLMIGQDTGSAILGPARADLYFGSGDDAGALAGGIKHYGRMFVLLPAPSDAGAAP